MSIKYSSEFVIPYYDTNKNGFLKSTTMLSYMMETSNLQSDHLGVGAEYLFKNNVAWMLNRWRVRFFKFPKVKEKITVETWCSGIDRFYALREFAAYDENGEKIAMATTQWVFVDVLKQRPKRVSQDMIDIYGYIDEKHFGDFYDFRAEFNTDTNSGEDYYVRKSDIDYNNHVNNVKYLDWILEVIPTEIDEDHLLYELEIQYKKQVKYGETINSSLGKSAEEITYLHKISNGKEINAYGKTSWRKK